MSSKRDWDNWSLAERAAYMDRVARDAYDHCCSILIGCPRRPTSEASSGSGVLVGIDGHYYVFTAKHVVDGLSYKRSEGSPAHFQVGMLNVHPDDRLVYADDYHDVAVLAIDASEIHEVGRRPYRPLGNWPPPLPEEGSCVLLNGFAARNRRSLERGKIEGTSLHFTAWVARPRDNHFYAQIARDGAETEHFKLMAGPGESLGGMSGGPVMAFTEDPLPLVGIISEEFHMLDAVRVSALCGVRLPHRSSMISMP